MSFDGLHNRWWIFSFQLCQSLHFVLIFHALHAFFNCGNSPLSSNSLSILKPDFYSSLIVAMGELLELLEMRGQVFYIFLTVFFLFSADFFCQKRARSPSKIRKYNKIPVKLETSKEVFSFHTLGHWFCNWKI